MSRHTKAWFTLNWRSLVWRWKLHTGRWLSLAGLTFVSVAGIKLNHGNITTEEFFIIVPVVLFGIAVFGTIMWIIVEALSASPRFNRLTAEAGPLAALLGIILTFAVIGYFVEGGG